MNKKISVKEIECFQEYCLKKVREYELYDIRNAAKIRSVSGTKTFEEFKDIVDAAHLKPLSEADKRNTKTKARLWNNTVLAENNE